MLHFREAQPADYEAICRLVPTERELYLVYPRGRHPFTVDQVRHLSEVRKELTVAINGSRVAGFANLYDFEGKQRAFIGNVVVDASIRGQGAGQRLVRYMMDKAFSKYDVREVHISVFNDNAPALLLYTKLGFVPYAVEERRNYNDEKVALIHMRIPRGEPNVPVK